MGMQCAVCGKKPVVGNQKTYRGKAKYLGGVGKKITGISKRKFKPNLQTDQGASWTARPSAGAGVRASASAAAWSSGRSSGSRSPACSV